ncbi:MAG: retroviral-like aspartic protease family protein [Steroidobacteraceae bacterium]
MSAFYLDMIAINPKREEIRSEPVCVMVDSGSELSWLPAATLGNAGITPRHKRSFRMADGRVMTRDVGYCILEAQGFSTTDEVVFAEPGDMCLLGVRTLEGFGVVVDAIAHRLLSSVTIVAGAAA